VHKIVKAEAYNRRPGWVRALNGGWRRLYPLGARVRLDRDRLIWEARRRTGLTELGGDFWEEPLDRLLSAIDAEADLHPLGRFITRERLVNLLCVRLRAEAAFRRHPEILEQALYPTLLIAGLQRTGTTKLQRLLGADPDNRLLLSWEALNPAPLSPAADERQVRIRQARRSERALQLLAPGFFAIHPVEHQAPEEDVLLLDVSFLSTTAEATMHVPSYSHWLETVDQTPAYSYLVKLLKLLQWQRPARRWVLKSPHHLEFLPLIETLFPQLHLIWPHRDVAQCVPSFLSMVAHGRAIFSDTVSADRVADHWVRKISYMLEQGMAFRRQASSTLITDLPYDNFVKAPIASLRRLYGEAGIPWNEALRDTFEQAERQQTPHRYGRHTYTPESFGWTADALRGQLQPYTGFLESLKE